ncbi:hypothetical protein JZ751_005880 [Albula glossodonta]|uniref:Uncharacterized protein n=1 Tax=Albula glossodonta TaxID=121402 RepID=A0A8T2P0N6_9TELE|nr:hypothetical protein JZ751_005880 [Albula glossodonta]
MSEKRPGADGSPQTENGHSKGISLKVNGEKENGHCQPLPDEQKPREKDEVDQEDSSSSEGKPKKPREQSSKKDRRSSRKNSSLSKNSSRISRTSNRSIDLFTSRRRRRNTASRKKISQAREKRFTFVLAVVMGQVLPHGAKNDDLIAVRDGMHHL